MTSPRRAPDRRSLAPRAWLALTAAGMLFLIPLLIFAALAEDVAANEVFAFDRPVMMWLHGHANPTLTTAMQVVTELGGLVVIPVVAVLAAAVLWWRGLRRDAAVLAAAVVGSTLLNTTLKAVFRRARPDFWEHLVTENSYSFPSGHAMASMALAATLVVLTWHTRWRWAALPGAAVYVLVVGVSRMYLGVHFPSDVLAGWSVAILWVGVVVGVLRLLDTWYRRRREDRR